MLNDHLDSLNMKTTHILLLKEKCLLCCFLVEVVLCLARHSSFISQYVPLSSFNSHVCHFYIPYTVAQQDWSSFHKQRQVFKLYHCLHHFTIWNFLLHSWRETISWNLAQIFLPVSDWQRPDLSLTQMPTESGLSSNNYRFRMLYFNSHLYIYSSPDM